MQLKHAVELLAPGLIGIEHPGTWADLGCGDGLFTRALAQLLPAGSSIHAMDTDAAALEGIPDEVNGVAIHTWRGDFLDLPWPFERLDGVLMGNALHYVRDKPAFLRACAAHAKPAHHLLIVEYDTDTPNPWVPYPVSRRALEALVREAGYGPFRLLATRRSHYQRAGMYAALVRSERGT